MTVIREIHETAPNVWQCQGCEQYPVPIRAPGCAAEPLTFGPCSCEGWTAEVQPDLVQLVEVMGQ